LHLGPFLCIGPPFVISQSLDITPLFRGVTSFVSLLSNLGFRSPDPVSFFIREGGINVYIQQKLFTTLT